MVKHVSPLLCLHIVLASSEHSPSADLRISIWQHSVFENTVLVALDNILSPVMLAEAIVSGQKRWVSVFLNHVRLNLHFVYQTTD
jgi:hypothetical protein